MRWSLLCREELRRYALNPRDLVGKFVSLGRTLTYRQDRQMEFSIKIYAMVPFLQLTPNSGPTLGQSKRFLPTPVYNLIA